MQGMTLLSRHARDTVEHRLSVFRVVVVTGARQVGKSTLARMVLERTPGVYVTLDDPETLTRAAADPAGLVASGGDGLLVIDEVQRVPDLLRAVKLEVDKDPRPGRFLLTGSANILEMRTVTESLAGRAAWVDLGPLTWSEIAGRPRPTVLDAAFAAGDVRELLAGLACGAEPAANAARHRALSGGMPETLDMDPENRRVWYDGYRRSFLERDLRQLSAVGNIPEFNRLMSLALLRSGGVVNRSDLASDAQVSHATASRYLGLLSTANQIRFLSPYLPNVGKRLVKNPKLFAVDSGAMAWALNAGSWEVAAAAGRDGALLETFVIDDVIATDSLGPAGSGYHFWRTSGGAEVDLVVQRGTDVVGIEVKSSSTLRTSDASGLRALRGDIGPSFRVGLVAYLGSECRELDERIVAVPIPRLLGVAGS